MSCQFDILTGKIYLWLLLIVTLIPDFVFGKKSHKVVHNSLVLYLSQTLSYSHLTIFLFVIQLSLSKC